MIIMISCLKLSDALKESIKSNLIHKSPRILLTKHAIIHNMLTSFRNEITQQQFDSIFSTVWDSHTNLYNNFILIESHIVFFIILAIMYKYSYPFEKNYKKLYINISDYRNISKIIKYITIIFIMVFLRGVQNAI